MPTQMQRVSKRLSLPRHRGNTLLLEHTAVPCPPQSKPCMCLLSMDTLATCPYYLCQCHQGMLTPNAASHSTHISHHGTAHLARSILYTRASRRPSTDIQRHPHSLAHAWQGLPTPLCPQRGHHIPKSLPWIVVAAVLFYLPSRHICLTQLWLSLSPCLPLAPLNLLPLCLCLELIPGVINYQFMSNLKFIIHFSHKLPKVLSQGQDEGK